MAKIAIKKTIGALLVIIGILALVTPLTPGAWLIFVGLGLLGFRMAAWDNVKARFQSLWQK